MKVVVGNIWTVKADYRIITTNGIVTKDGNAVMGRGVALQAKQKYPGIEKKLGILINVEGNRLHVLPHGLISFPVKHHWKDKADLSLISESVLDLKCLASGMPGRIFAMPLPGTGNGRRTPEEIWPLLQDLPDNVLVIILDPLDPYLKIGK